MMRNLFCIFCAFAFLFFLCPQEAKAFDGCVPKKNSGQYTESVVKCVQEPVKTATINMMNKLSDIFRPVVLVLSTLAIVFFGISIIDAGGSVGPPAFMFILRLGIVSFFSYNLGGFAEKILGTSGHEGILDQLLKMVTASNYSPWQQIDIFVGELLGFAKDGDHKELKDGVIGLLNGSATVKLEGAMLTGVGIYTLWTVLSFMFEAVFLYLTSIMVIGFLIVISPLIIPFAVFNYGGQYVKQWFNVLLSAIIAPMIAFAILWIFVGNGTTSNTGIFKSLVDDVFAAMPDNGKDYLAKNLHTNQSIFTLLQTVDSEEQKSLAEKKCLDADGKPIADCNTEIIVPNSNPLVNPTATEQASDKVKVPAVDFGTQDAKIKKALFLAFLHLLIFSYIMKVMMQKIQGVASAIAGIAANKQISSTGGGSPLSSMGITSQIG